MKESVCVGKRVSTFWVEQLGQAEVLLCQVKGILQVVVSVRLLQFIKVDQIRSENNAQRFSSYNNNENDLSSTPGGGGGVPVFVNDSIEGHPVPPAAGEVMDVDI